MASVTANATTSRDATMRGRYGVPWKTVAVLAVTLAYADGYWLVSLQGAVGAIGRTDHPFATWLRESTVVLPVFALAVLGALTLALRWFGSEPGRTRTVVATALLVVACGTVAGLAAIVASAAYDYHLQVAQLQVVHELSSLHGHCDSNCLAQEDRDTLAVQVRGVVVVSRWILLTNLVLVAWVVAIMGGRIRVSSTRCRKGGPTEPGPNPAGTVTQVRHLLVGALVALAVIHAAVVPQRLSTWTAAGVFFILLATAELAVAGLLLAGVRRRTVLLVAAAISIGPSLVWLYSRTVGMPFGPEPGIPRSPGVPDCLALALEVGSLLAAVALLRAPLLLLRRSPASAHVLGLVVVALIAVTTIGVSASGLSWLDAFGVS